MFSHINRQEIALKSTTLRGLGREKSKANGKEPAWHQRPANIKAMMIYPASGFREMQELGVRVIRISEGDAIIFTSKTPEMNDTFYLDFDAASSPPVSCWVIRKTSNGIYCHFQNEISASTVERIIVEHEMRNALDSLWGSLNGDEGESGPKLPL
jgi:hypothetical protein